MQLLKEIRCHNKLNNDFICGRWLGDMEVYPHTKTFPCKRCEISWSVEQTEDGNLIYTKTAIRRERKDYDDSGVAIVNE